MIDRVERANRDIEHHALIASEYERVVNGPRKLANQALFAAVNRFLPHVRASMLDLGCGTGQMLDRFSAGFQRVLGVDHSAAMLAVARVKHDNARSEFKLSDVLAFLADATEQFDLITAVGFLHHLDPNDARSVIQSVRARLRPGGCAVFAEPLEFNPSREPALFRFWNAPFRQAFQGYTVEAVEPEEAPIPEAALRTWIEAAGLRVLHFERAWEIFPRFGGNWLDRLCTPLLHRFQGQDGVVGLFVVGARQI